MDFGAYLRQAREREGVALRQIANATKISTATLEALERNDIRRLPGGIFTRAVVRAYAAEVGLDQEETVRQFLEHFSTEGVADGSPYVKDSREEEVFESQRKVMGTAVRLIGASLPVAAMIVYLTLGSGGSSTTLPPADGASADRSTSGVEEQKPLTIVVLAERSGWVSLRIDGKSVIARTMQPREREAHGALHEIVLNLGDATAVSFTINERLGRPGGQAGEVVTLRITPENYADFLQ